MANIARQYSNLNYNVPDCFQATFLRKYGNKIREERMTPMYSKFFSLHGKASNTYELIIPQLVNKCTSQTSCDGSLRHV